MADVPSLLPKRPFDRDTCRSCGKVIENQNTGAGRRRRYCDERCRKAFRDQLKREAKELANAGYDDQQLLLDHPGKTGFGNRITETTKLMRKMALGRIEDEVRDEVRRQVAEEVSPVVKDKLHGIALAMTELLPIALAGIAIDLESDDWMIRGRARDALLKYSMPFAKMKADDATDGRYVVEHHLVPHDGMPLVQPAAEATEEPPPILDAIVDIAEAERTEREEATPEEDWKECPDCGRTLPPAAGRPYTVGGSGWRCMTCHAKRDFERDRNRPPRSLTPYGGPKAD